MATQKHHSYDIDVICAEAQKDLTKAVRTAFGDDPIFRFRLSGMKRLWGYRRGATFHVMRWDPQHEVCPPGK